MVSQKKQVYVIIPGGSKTFQNIWKSAWDKGVFLDTFEGIADIPRGIRGIRADHLMEASRQESNNPLPENMVFVVLSNGWTVEIPVTDIYVIAQNVETS